MVKITKSAESELLDYLKKNNIIGNQIRVFISGLGWGGPRLSLASDYIHKDDTVFETENLSFLLDPTIRGAMESYGNVSIDYQKSFLWGSGFKIRFVNVEDCK